MKKLLLIFLIIPLVLQNGFGSETPKANNGVLDLRKYDLNKDGNIFIEGKWEYYWKQLLLPSDFADSNYKPSGFVITPGSIADYNFGGERLDGSGYGTYRLLILLNDSIPSLSFLFKIHNNSYKVFVDGKQVLKVGNPASSQDSCIYGNSVFNIVTIEKYNTQLELVIQSSDFKYNNAGLTFGFIEFGHTSIVLNKIAEKSVYYTIFDSIILFMGLYHLLIFILRRKETINLIFSLLCFNIILISSIAGINYKIINFASIINLTINHLTPLVIIAYNLFFLFYYKVFPKDFSIIALRILQCVSIVFLILNIIFPFTTLKTFWIITEILYLIYMLYSFIVLIIAFKRKRENSLIVLILYCIYPFLILAQLPGQMLAMFLVISQSIILSIRFSNSLTTVEKQSIELSKHRDNLEELVTERTNQLNIRNEELEALNTELADKNYQITEQNENILASINYAKRIQQAILPVENSIKRTIKDIFILYQPRDIVSGDFYWFSEVDDTIIFAVVDCTGHGVPGAFMSMIGNDLLNYIVNQKKIITPSQILEELDKGVRYALKQDERSSRDDGMDVCIISIKDIKSKPIVTFSGAMRPLYYTIQNNLYTIKGDKRSIGGRLSTKRTFTDNQVEITEMTMLYLTTDGFSDLHSTNNEKYGLKRFQKFLEKISGLKVSEQKQQLENEVLNFTSGEKIIDDITVVGIKLNY